MKQKWRIRKVKKLFVVGIVISLLFTGTTAFKYDDGNDFEIVKSLDIFFSVFRELNANYVDPVDAGGLIHKAIDAMLSSLDPYTVYYPESKIEEYRYITTGEYGGVGMDMKIYNNRYIITELYEDYPAANSGLKVGDEIRKIQEKSISGFTIDEIGNLLKGQANSYVQISVYRPGDKQEFDYVMQRKNIKMSSVPYSTVLENGSGYISLTAFTQVASKEVKNALDDLQSNNINGLVLDLRGNPGGLLVEAVNIVNLFVDEGQNIVSIRGKIDAKNRSFKTRFDADEPDLPVVVLINSGSASASEIVSGALQDLDRAVIIGERSFGKGLVQNTLSLDYNTRMKVTTAKYYIPSGRCIQALDYTHRREDGSVGHVPDSLISEFTTTTGRKVYDGGGIRPDISIEKENFLTITRHLINEMMIFDFVTEYLAQNEVTFEQLPLGFNVFNQFEQFIEDNNFNYESETQKQFEKLVSAAKKENYYDRSKDEFSQFETDIEEMKSKDLKMARNEILELINEEIAKRIAFRKGKIKFTIQNDTYIKESLKVLNNSDQYNSILNIK